MSKTTGSAILVFAFAIPAAAQESLLPTYVNQSGEVTVEATFRYLAGQATLSAPIAEADFESTNLFGDLRAGVGLGGRFEIEASVPFVFDSTAEAEEGGLEVEFETAGLGDLSLEANYLITPASKTSPQVVGGLIVVLPTGDNDFAEPEVRFNGVQIEEGKEGGLGDGVVKVGLGFAVGKQLTGAHVYGAARFLISTGTDEEDDLEIDRPDVFSVVGGAMVDIGAHSSLDIRAIINYVGDEVAEDDTGAESTDEAHVNVTLEPRLYFSIGDTATLILGGAVGWEQDHAVDEEAELEVEDAFTYGVSLGLHLRLGGGKNK
jgi:hypothetical protein